MRALAQGRCAVQHMAGIRDDFFAALGVVGLARGADFGRAAVFGNDIGAIQRVVQAAPAGVGGVQGITGVEHRHHQLRPGLHCQLGIHVFGGDAGFLRHGHQVANALQKCLISRHVGDRAGMGFVPGIDLELQAVAFGQQCNVLWRQIGHDGVKAFPEGVGADAGAGQDLVINELLQYGGDLQTGDGGAGGSHNDFVPIHKTGGQSALHARCRVESVLTWRLAP